MVFGDFRSARSLRTNSERPMASSRFVLGGPASREGIVTHRWIPLSLALGGSGH